MNKISYITIAVLILSLSITPMLFIVSAEDKKRPRIALEDHTYPNLAIISGYGKATDNQDDQVYRTRIRLAGEILVNTNEDTNSSKRFQVFRGRIVILDNGTRTKYSVVNENWSGTIGKGSFVANGTVQDEEGNEYRVHLKGDAVRRNGRGIQMLVECELNGDGVSFKLLYIAVLKHRHLRAHTPIPE